MTIKFHSKHQFIHNVIFNNTPAAGLIGVVSNLSKCWQYYKSCKQEADEFSPDTFKELKNKIKCKAALSIIQGSGNMAFCAWLIGIVPAIIQTCATGITLAKVIGTVVAAISVSNPLFGLTLAAAIFVVGGLISSVILYCMDRPEKEHLMPNSSHDDHSYSSQSFDDDNELLRSLLGK